MSLQFTTGDIETALDIMREAAQWQIDQKKLLWGLHTLTRERLANPPEEYHVAWMDGESAACCLLSFEDSFFWPNIPAGTSGFVHKIAVRRKFAGQGLAAQVIDYAAQCCRAKGIPVLRLDTDVQRPKLCALYEGLGFRRVGAVVKDLSKEGNSAALLVALYEKELP